MRVPSNASVEPRAGETTIELVRGSTVIARWPLLLEGRPDLAIVERLARMLVAARRMGCTIRVPDPCPALRELLELAGLSDVLLGREALGEAEQPE